MKIAVKIALGYGVLIALLFAVLAYQNAVISRTERLTADLSAINFRSAVLSVELLRNLDLIEEFTRKYFVTADPDYADQASGMGESFAQLVEAIRGLRLSPAEAEEFGRLREAWSRFQEAASRSGQRAGPPNPQQLLENQADELARLERVRMQALGFLRSTQQSIAAQVGESARASLRAQRLSLAAALAALLVSLAVSFWIVRSISRPLARLTEATQAVAAGRFSHRLDVEGRDELSRLARDFDTMTRRLNELDELKKDFVSHVSHELKSPLASIQETARLLLDRIPGPLTPDQARFLELSLQSSRRLSSLIGNLLDLSRIEAGVMEYSMQPQDLGQLLRTALAELEVQFQEKGLKMEARLPEQAVWVECDGDLMLQVIGNVLGNALKFSPPSRALEVVLRHAAEIPGNVPESWRSKGRTSRDGAGYAVVSIADRGPGIPDSEKEKIFEKFHQAKGARGTGPSAPARREAGRGTGLGLAIARTIVEAHRGAIWVENNPGGGSVFQILLPAGAGSERGAPPATTPI